MCSSHFVIMSTEQRTNIKFCVLLHKTTAETLTLLEEAYAEEAMKKFKCMPCINASLVAAIASKITYATATAFPRNQKLPRDTSKGKVMLEVYSRRSYCYETIVRRNPPLPAERSEKETSRKQLVPYA